MEKISGIEIYGRLEVMIRTTGEYLLLRVMWGTAEEQNMEAGREQTYFLQDFGAIEFSHFISVKNENGIADCVCCSCRARTKNSTTAFCFECPWISLAKSKDKKNSSSNEVK